LYTILQNSYYFCRIIAKKYDLIDNLFIWSSVKTFSWLNIPNNEHISGLLSKITYLRGILEKQVIENQAKKPNCWCQLYVVLICVEFIWFRNSKLWCLQGILGNFFELRLIFSIGGYFYSWISKNIHEILLSCPLKKVWLLERMCLITTVETSG